MSASTFLNISVFVAILIPLFLTYRAEGGFKTYSKRTLIFLIAWITVTYISGKLGIFQDFSAMPPRFFLLLPTILIVLYFLMKTKHTELIVNNISIYVLIGIQSFRFFPEIFLDLSYREGLAPIQMTYHGRNLDILVAALALTILVLNKRIPISPKKLGVIFSFIGLGLLINILTIAILSTPTPIRYFMNEPANTFVTEAPYIWLPTVFVSLAFWGHFILIKKLLRKN